MANIFLAASINNNTVYVKCDEAFHESIHDLLYDVGYKITRTSPQVWDYYIETGDSYEIDTVEELNDFTELNNTAHKLREGYRQQ